MRLTQASDFALRILMLLTQNKEPMTVDTVSGELKLVKSHVMKIVARLAKAGLVNSTRGRSGGISLGRPPEDITIGEVVRVVEADFAVVECMKDEKSNCVFAPRCRLRGLMSDAKLAFLQVLDGQTLREIAVPVSQ